MACMIFKYPPSELKDVVSKASACAHQSWDMAMMGLDLTAL